ncbi:MAG: hypothetical protein LC739_08055 [Actinobacteria bacterium]|nr:hypothetical protein [Actinomycetota bacterium]
MRTPLTAVMGFATELAEAWDRFDDSEARNVVQLIARQSAASPTSSTTSSA